MNIHQSALPNGYVIDGPDRFRVHRQVFVDPDILAEEMNKIFGRCWLYLGHESELPNKGDYLVRVVAGHNLIFVRGRDNQLRALFNVCPHRGATVCRDKGGNTKLFRCLYHSWSFDTNGKTAARPDPERYADGIFDDGAFDLKPVAQIANYRGFVFIHFDSNSESLEDYLAGSKPYLNRIADKSEVQMEVVGSHHYGVAANWKTLAENGIDGYHATLHSSYMEYMINVGEMDLTNNQISLTEALAEPLLDLGNGHAVTVYRGPWSRPVARSLPKWSKEAKEAAAEVQARLEEIHGEEYADQLCNDEFNMLIFPNLAVNDHFSTNIRFLEPDGVGRMKANSWSLGPREEPDVLREIRKKNFINFLGPGGLATPDDAEALLHCQLGYANDPDRWNDLSRGLNEETQIDTDELTLRVFWREWNRRMCQS